MAGPFTHMAVVEEAKNRLGTQTTLGVILHEQPQFLVLGCVAPDIPYLSLLGQSGWADVFHYQRTGSLVDNGIHSLLATKQRTRSWRAQLAWLCGYAAHLVTDATIHPMVEAIVGPYTEPAARAPHTECEMVQDVLIFQDVLNLDLTATEYSNQLLDAQSGKLYPAVIEFWATHAHHVAPTLGQPDPSDWVKCYAALIDTAEGGSGLARVSRHIGVKYVYKTADDLTQNHADLVDRYYKSVALPNGLTGAFLDEGFTRTVTNLVDVWTKIDRALFTKANIARIVANWDLDTGIDQDTNARTYWG